MLRSAAAAVALAVLAFISLPLLALRALRRRGLPQPLPAPHQFAFERALPAYEALIDITAARNA